MRLVWMTVAFASLAGATSADELTAIGGAVPVCERAQCFSLQLHVATGDTGLVTTPAFIATQVLLANTHFAPLDVGFQLAGVDALSASAAEIKTPAERSALAAGGPTEGAIDVFVTGELHDVDVADKVLNGVAWRAPKLGKKFIILSAKAFDRTLAHELGHVFGLPHSTYAISIMNKTPREEPPQEDRTFAEQEIAAMRRRLRTLVRTKVIVPLAKRQVGPQ
jgi:hypothetical protein